MKFIEVEYNGKDDSVANIEKKVGTNGEYIETTINKNGWNYTVEDYEALSMLRAILQYGTRHDKEDDRGVIR